MTEERGLIGNWLTWPRYTWSHNISHPSRVGEFDAFFNKHLHGSRTSSFFFCPHTGFSLAFCGWKIVWMKPCCLTRSKPSLQRGRVGMIFAWRMQLSQLWVLENELHLHILSFMCRCPATASKPTTEKERKPHHTHWCQESRSRISSSSFFFPTWTPGVIFVQEHWAASAWRCRNFDFTFNRWEFVNAASVHCKHVAIQAWQGRARLKCIGFQLLHLFCITWASICNTRWSVLVNMISPITTIAPLVTHAWWERVCWSAICE